jgi:hypothetical protein
MSGIITKYSRLLILVTAVLLADTGAYSQEHRPARSLKFTAGFGYGRYFNTFTNVTDENISLYNPSVYGKLVWEPEHRLTIGFESGYYRIYSTERIEVGTTSRQLKTNMSAIPLFICFGMKMTRHLDLNFATGGLIVDYKVIPNRSKSNSVKGSTLSLFDYSAGLTWHVPFGKRTELGSEIKYMFIGKTTDNHLSAFITLSYRIVRLEFRKH